MRSNSILVEFFFSNIVINAETGIDNLHFNRRPLLILSVQIRALLVYLTNVMNQSSFPNQLVAFLLLLIVNVHQMRIYFLEYLK